MGSVTEETLAKLTQAERETVEFVLQFSGTRTEAIQTLAKQKGISTSAVYQSLSTAKKKGVETGGRSRKTTAHRTTRRSRATPKRAGRETPAEAVEVVDATPVPEAEPVVAEQEQPGRELIPTQTAVVGDETMQGIANDLTVRLQQIDQELVEIMPRIEALHAEKKRYAKALKALTT